MIGEPNDDISFPHELVLTNKIVSKILKALSNDSWANTKLSKSHLSMLVQLSGFKFDFLIHLVWHIQRRFKNLQNKFLTSRK